MRRHGWQADRVRVLQSAADISSSPSRSSSSSAWNSALPEGNRSRPFGDDVNRRLSDPRGGLRALVAHLARLDNHGDGHGGVRLALFRRGHFPARQRFDWNPSPDLEHSNILLAGLLLMGYVVGSPQVGADPTLEPVLRTSAERVTKTDKTASRQHIWIRVSVRQSWLLRNAKEVPCRSGDLSPGHSSAKRALPALHRPESARPAHRAPRRLSSRSDPIDEVELDLASVQVSREVDQMGLDLPGNVAESWIWPDVHAAGQGQSSCFDPGKPGVDAFGGDQLSIRQIDRGKPDRGPSAGALFYRAADSMRPAKIPGGFLDMPVAQTLSNQ